MESIPEEIHRFRGTEGSINAAPSGDKNKQRGLSSPPPNRVEPIGTQTQMDKLRQLPKWAQEKILKGEMNDQLSAIFGTAQVRTEFKNVEPTRKKSWEDRFLDIASAGGWLIGWLLNENYDAVSSTPALADLNPPAKALMAAGLTAGDVTGTRDIVEGLREEDTLQTRKFTPQESFEKVLSGSTTAAVTIVTAGLEGAPSGTGAKPRMSGVRAGNAAAEALDAGLVNVPEGRMGFQTYSSGRAVRNKLGIPAPESAPVGRAGFEAAHMVPQAVLERVGASKGTALTANLPESIHKAFDNGWKPAWEAMKRSGKAITAGDIQTMLERAVDQIPNLSPAAKGTLKWKIELELQHDLELSPSTIVVPASPKTHK